MSEAAINKAPRRRAAQVTFPRRLPILSNHRKAAITRACGHGD
jgi:hypothetical protein